MPRLSVWMIRAALIYFGCGVTLGALLLWNKGLPVAGAIWRLLPAHLEFVLFGWILQLALGVAFWIMPRFTGTARFGQVRWAWAGFGLLNVGILAVVIGSAAGSEFSAVGRGLQLIGAAAFAVQLYPRIKPFGV